MDIIKKILMVLLLSVLGLAGLYTASNRGWLPATWHVPTLTHVSLPTQPLDLLLDRQSLQGAVASAQTQIGTLAERGSEVSLHTNNVLGSMVEVNQDQKQPIHQRALEYGRYVYCQEVVREYEAAHPSPSPNKK